MNEEAGEKPHLQCVEEFNVRVYNKSIEYNLVYKVRGPNKDTFNPLELYSAFGPLGLLCLLPFLVLFCDDKIMKISVFWSKQYLYLQDFFIVNVMDKASDW